MMSVEIVQTANRSLSCPCLSLIVVAHLKAQVISTPFVHIQVGLIFNLLRIWLPMVISQGLAFR